MDGIRKILVPCRTTPYCGSAIRTGVTLARMFLADLYVIRLLSGPVDIGVINAPGIFPSRESPFDHPSIEEEAKEELDRVIRDEIGNDFPIRELVGTGNPVEEIERAVREENIDLLVMLAHSEGRLEHFLANENHTLIRKLPCSILLVKQEPQPCPIG